MNKIVYVTICFPQKLAVLWYTRQKLCRTPKRGVSMDISGISTRYRVRKLDFGNYIAVVMEKELNNTLREEAR